MNPLIRIVVIVVFLGILVSLGSALYQLTRTNNDSRKMVRALTVRIGLSILLFVLLMVAWYLGLIEPHGIEMPRPQ
jgi:cytochrome bd-type quinol oxidase subunit 2